MPATITETMRAVRIHAFGGPEMLQYEDARTPEPAADDMLIRVRAAGVNPVDWKIREGYFGKSPLPAILGRDFSGTVEALGQNVRGFRVGDEVFGEAASGSGTYAEFTLAKPSQSARKPRSLDHVQAAALPVASLTAWQALFDTAGLRASQRVLIHAAAGGVGGFAVQFAKLEGAYVIGTASAQNAAYARELGADEVIDYRATRFEDVVRDVDVVFDAIGGDTQEAAVAGAQARRHPRFHRSAGGRREVCGAWRARGILPAESQERDNWPRSLILSSMAASR